MGDILRQPYVIPVCSALQALPAASATVYISNFQSAPGVNPGVLPLPIPFPNTLMRVVIKAVIGTVGSAETGSIYVRLNNTTDYLVTDTMKWNTNIALGFNLPDVTGPVITQELTVDDFFEIKFVYPAWGTPPINVFYSGLVLFNSGF